MEQQLIQARLDAQSVKKLIYKYSPGRWVTVDEGEILRNIGRLCPEVKNYYECGTANGYSTCWAILGLSSEANIHTFDVVDRPKVWNESAFNLSQFKPRVNFHLGSFEKGIGSLLDDREGSSIFFIDGEHSVGGVSRDWHAIRSYLRRGDVIILHDLIMRNVAKNWQRIKTANITSRFIDFETKRCIGVIFYDAN